MFDIIVSTCLGVKILLPGLKPSSINLFFKFIFERIQFPSCELALFLVLLGK